MNTRRWLMVLAGIVAAALGGIIPAAGQPATPAGADDTVSMLTALYAGPGVIFRAPENCVGGNDPYSDPATLAFCAVKDVVGALGGPPSSAKFIETPDRFAFNQPLDCATAGAIADGLHDNCAVVTGAATLLRAGLPVRLFGVCARALPQECAPLGTITDPTWKPDGVYLLLDPAQVTTVCQYAQDSARNGCNAHGAYTAGRERLLCADDAADPMCEYAADETAAMLAAYIRYCTEDAANCLENQIQAQWSLDAVIAIGYLNRADQAWDCEVSRAKAARFAAAVNTRWSADFPTVQIAIDVASNELRFGDAATGCGPLPAPDAA